MLLLDWLVVCVIVGSGVLALWAFLMAINFYCNWRKWNSTIQDFMQLLQEAEEHSKKERYQEALQSLRRASSLQPENHAININLAQCYALLEQYDQMRPELNYALSIDPDSRESQYLWLHYLTETRQYDEALKLAKQYVQRYSDDADAWNLLGNVFVKLNDKQGMLDAHLAAHQRAPKVSMYMRNVGYCYSKQKHWSKAIEWTKRGMEKEPDSISGLCNLAHYELCSGNVAEASRLIAKVLEKKPDYPGALEEQGWVYYVTGQYEQAEAVWQRAGEIKPSVHENHEETRAEMDELIQQGVFAL